MPKVTIYTTDSCGYCARAKQLLARKRVAFDEIDVTWDGQRRAEMERRSGRQSVPQIWIGETHVGGCDDIHDLERHGKLDSLLAV